MEQVTPQSQVKHEYHLATARLAQVLKTIFHQCALSYTCSKFNSDGSKTEPSELD